MTMMLGLMSLVVTEYTDKDTAAGAGLCPFLLWDNMFQYTTFNKGGSCQPHTPAGSLSYWGSMAE